MHTPEDVTNKALEQLKASKADCLVSALGMVSEPRQLLATSHCAPRRSVPPCRAQVAGAGVRDQLRRLVCSC